MKIRTKLLVGILALFLVSQMISFAVLYSVQSDYKRTVMELETHLIWNKDRQFSNQIEAIKNTNMDTLEKETMLKYVFRQNMKTTAALYQGERALYNATPYDFSYKKMKNYMEKRGGEDVFSTRFTENVNGKSLLIDYREKEIWGENYQIYQVADMSSVEENMRKNALLGLKTGGFAVLFGGGFLYLLLKKMLQPLEKLTLTAKKIAGGNYKERAQIKASGEIGILTEQFNLMAQNVEEKIESLCRMNEQQLRLIGSLSHEIKTPMTAILGYTQMLRYRADLQEEQKEKALMYMDSECRRLSALAGKMMELCGLYQEKNIAVREEKIYPMVSECLEKMAFRMKESGISAEIFCEDMAVTYLVDRDLFVSYIWNILENAVRASSFGERIKIVIEKERLLIQDEGIGIPKEDLDKVQEAFYMVEKSRSRKEGGAGLGLSLCSRIAKVHGASMEIESCAGEGTTVIWRNDVQKQNGAEKGEPEK